MAKILFITVDYRRPDLTIALLNNFAQMNFSRAIDIIIADNTPEEESSQELNNYVAGVRGLSVELIKTGKNLGYFGAANFVLNQLSHFSAKYQAVIIANNDIEIKDPLFFIKLVSVTHRAAVIAPDVVSTVTLRHQNPHRIHPLSRLQKLQYRLLYMNYYSGAFLFYARKFLKSIVCIQKKTACLDEGEIFSAHGSFMIFTQKYFLGGGRIDSGYFLYGEEDSVAAQCARLGFPILYFPGLVVYHNEHQTTQSEGFKKAVYYWQKKAYTYIRSHYPGLY